MNERDDALHNRLAVLHREVLAGKDSSKDALCRLAEGELLRQLRAWRPRDDPDYRHMAVDDALQVYCGAPHQYQANRGSLLAWLMGIARHRLLDAGRQRRRRWAKEVSAGLDLSQWSVFDPASDGQACDEVMQHRWDELRAVAKSDAERAFIQALRNGDRSSQAEALEVSKLPESDIVREICRIRQNLFKRLQWRFRSTEKRQPKIK